MNYFASNILGKANRPRYFKNININKLPISWYSNRTAWMNSKISAEWLHEFDLIMKKQKRHSCFSSTMQPVHPQGVELENIKLKFFPVNTTAKIQPMDQGIIKTFKAYYRKHLVKHIIVNATTAMTVDDVNITALDAVYWIQTAWEMVTSTTIKNTFRSAGFEKPNVVDGLNVVQISSIINEDTSAADKSIEELDRLLKLLCIGGKLMSANEYVVRSPEILKLYFKSCLFTISEF